MIQLFCIPYAGSSASIFVSWRERLREYINCVPLELSGRGSRFSEPLYTSMGEAAGDLCAAIQAKQTGGEYFVWGHSMGGLLAYEACLKLLKSGAPLPKGLIVSASASPDASPRNPNIHTSPDEMLVGKLKEYGGTPERVFREPEILRIAIPIIRADLRIINTYIPRRLPVKIPLPIHVFYGECDTLVPFEALSTWSRYSDAQCQYCSFKGSHFFIHDQVDTVAQAVLEITRPWRELG